ncbi:MAG: DUF389 domain-containing protein [Actinomycetota bacterium]|nr:DUF389 domain-containing protein [Actinomycetota bacterium]
MAELVHVQIVATERTSRRAAEVIDADPSACNIVHLRDAARSPRGDVFMFDIAREGINGTLGRLRQLGVEEDGAISVFHTDLALSRRADTAHDVVPGEPDDTVIWDEVAATLRQSVSLRFAYLAYFAVAAVIAAAGILTDSPILIVGAMVVGPEYGPLASMGFGVQSGDVELVRKGFTTFLVGSGFGAAAGLATALVVRALDRVPAVYEEDGRSLTAFITEPDLFSVIVAVAAAVAGTLALTQDRSGTLVGVLISVTTIPAIADIGVGLAFGDGGEVAGAAAQLGINLVCLVSVGALTLTVLRRITPGGTGHDALGAPSTVRPVFPRRDGR